jgi:hypothetical protein
MQVERMVEVDQAESCKPSCPNVVFVKDDLNALLQMEILLKRGCFLVKTLVN